MSGRNIKFVFGFHRLIPFLGYHHVLMILIITAIIILCMFVYAPSQKVTQFNSIRGGGYLTIFGIFVRFGFCAADYMVMITRRHRCIGIGVCLLMEAFCSALLLASCSSSSPMIPSIFLMSLWYNQGSPEFDPAQVRPITSLDIGKLVGDAELEARVGYFGICINADGGSWLCSQNASSLAAQVSQDQDPLNLIWVAETFKGSIVFPYLLIIAIILCALVLVLLASFPVYEQESADGIPRKRLPSTFISQICLAIIFVASIFVLVSVLWQHTASVAASTIAENLGNGSIETGVGVTSMVLGWFGFALLIIVTIGLLVMILSMQLVERLTDLTDSDEED